MEQTQEKLDPSIIALSKAIGHQESGGDYNKIGDNGHSKGAYQWNNKTKLKEGEIPANFRSYATEVGANTEDFSPTNQDRVAYKTVEKWGKAGLTPAQISSRWNSGGADTYKTAVPGYNAEQGVHYDVKKYVESVAKYYDEFNKGNQTSQNVSQGTSDLTKDTIIGGEGVAQPDQPSQHTGTVGTNPNDSLYGKLIDNSVTRGIMNVGNALSFGGAKQLGNQVGGSLAIMGEKAKGLVGGKDNAKYIPEPSFGETVKGAAKVVGSAGLLAGSSLLQGTKALANPKIINILKQGVQTRQGAIERLTAYLSNTPLSKMNSKTEQLVLQAIKELSPTLIERKSLFNKLVRGGYDLAKTYALFQLLGDKVGGAVNKIIP